MKTRWRTRQNSWSSGVKTWSLSSRALSAWIKSQNSTVNRFIVLTRLVHCLDVSQQPILPQNWSIHGIPSSSPPTPAKCVFGVTNAHITAKKREHNTLLPVRSSCQCHKRRWQIDVITPTEGNTIAPISAGEICAGEDRVTRILQMFAKTRCRQ